MRSISVSLCIQPHLIPAMCLLRADSSMTNYLAITNLLSRIRYTVQGDIHIIISLNLHRAQSNTY